MAKQMMAKLVGSRVYVRGKQTKKQKKNDQPADPKKIGKVHNLVFSADSRVVVGVMLKRPDIAGMVKQDDRFIPLDALKFVDAGVICRGEKGDFDKDACKRLSLDLDHCIIWGGTDVYCESGKFLGYVMDASVDVETGEVDCFCAQEGSTASSLVGTFDIPAAWVVRYDRGRMIVKDQAAKIELSGGLAGKAGEGYAAAKEGAKQAASKAGAAASVAGSAGTSAAYSPRSPPDAASPPFGEASLRPDCISRIRSSQGEEGRVVFSSGKAAPRSFFFFERRAATTTIISVIRVSIARYS